MSLPPLPELTTERLKLRRLKQSDAAALFALRSNAEVNQYLGRKADASTEDTQAFISKIEGNVNTRQSFYWAITLADNIELIGTICIWNVDEANAKADIGYELLPAFKGRGLMKEAVTTVIDYVFKHTGFTCIEGYTHKDNAASATLLTKCGFRFADTAPEYDEVIYRLIK